MPNLYRNNLSDPKANAQRELSGRTHYVDDDTLRYFHSRILDGRAIAGGLLFYIVESCALDPNNRKRGFRAVLFDLWGHVLLRDKMEDTCRSTNAAVKKLSEFLATFNATAYTLEQIEKERTRDREDLDQLAAKVLTLTVKNTTEEV